jgi:two-component system cell cycle response regulator
MENLDKVIRVLVVDDDVAFCSSFADVLNAMGYEVLTANDPRDVPGILSHAEVDVVLVDLRMPHLGGLELIRIIRQDRPNLPIIVVSANGTAADTAVAMSCGASDFMTKPVDIPFLEVRMQRACEIENARRLSNTDPLTGLFNRRFFLERLDEEVERATRYSRPLSLIMADLDHFKTINDTFGHARGDEVLTAISRVLRGLIRSVDILVRFGGDEFIVLLPETPMAAAAGMAERGRRTVDALEWNDKLFAGGEHVSVSMSFGVAAFSAGLAGEKLILAADKALYQAKREGGNCVFRGSERESEDRRRRPNHPIGGCNVLENILPAT